MGRIDERLPLAIIYVPPDRGELLDEAGILAPETESASGVSRASAAIILRPFYAVLSNRCRNDRNLWERFRPKERP